MILRGYAYSAMAGIYNKIYRSGTVSLNKDKYRFSKYARVVQELEQK